MLQKWLTGSVLSAVLTSTLWTPLPAEEARTNDERVIRELEERQVAAVLEQDAATLERQWSPELIVNNPQNGITPNRDGVIDRVKRGLIRYSRYDLKIDAIRVRGDLAIVMGSETVLPVGDAPRAGQTVRRRYTNIWQRTGSTWVMVARHANVVLTEK
jgi:ketosteroid isomerase-like protein